jgi:pSer/pThr/pTyr-binding forkhead associated (FHA) protein
VSRRHAKISVTPKGVFVEDLGSQNGTTINGVAVRQPSPIRPGDIVRIGHVPLFYFGFVNPETPPEMEIVENAILLNPVVSFS